jgi:Uma2 family endonuclease
MTMLLSPPKTISEVPAEATESPVEAKAGREDTYLTSKSVGEHRVLLQGIRWDTYVSLLADLEDKTGPRLTYDHGVLEIMSPLPLHEENNRNIQLIVEMLAMVWRIHIRNLGSVTLKREDLERGFEPDSCFYIQSVDQVDGLEQINLTAGDPAPDLIIEIDFTSPSLEKFPLYAEIGVPEIWHLKTRGEHIKILQLSEGQYIEKDRSIAFPLLTQQALVDFVLFSRTALRFDWLEAVRDWAREQAENQTDEQNTAS